MRDKKLTITLELLPIGTKVSKPIMEEGGMTTYTLKQPYIAINSKISQATTPCTYREYTRIISAWSASK